MAYTFCYLRSQSRVDDAAKMDRTSNSLWTDGSVRVYGIRASWTCACITRAVTPTKKSSGLRIHLGLVQHLRSRRHDRHELVADQLSVRICGQRNDPQAYLSSNHHHGRTTISTSPDRSWLRFCL